MKKDTRSLAIEWWETFDFEKKYIKAYKTFHTEINIHKVTDEDIEHIYLSEHPQTTEKGEDVQVDSEYENAIRNACLVALEFGYVQCEKGNNLQMAFMNYNKIISNK